MPRKTPVRELQKEEVVAVSPVRRSSRLNASSPVPTKIVTRRNSSSEESSQIPKLTRSRRLSLSQETETNEEQDKKKPTSTIRTRRSSLTQQIKDEEVVEPVRASRTRSISLPKEDTPVKRTTRRQRSTSEEPENTEDTTKKITRSRSASLTKNNESGDANTTKKKSIVVEDASASTPIKKSGSTNEPLESIEEVNKEVDSPDDTSSTNSNRKTIEASKIDFDLSVINETSITEEDEERSPKKTKLEEMNGASREPEIESEVKPKLQENSVGTVTNSDVTEPKKSDPPLVKDLNEALDSTSDSSFNLQLSSSIPENIGENPTDAHDLSDKENVRPRQDSEVEPMEVDDSTYNIFSPKQNKSPKVSVGLKASEVEQKLQNAEKINDAMVEFLSQEIQNNSEDKSEESNRKKIQNEDKTTTSAIQKETVKNTEETNQKEIQNGATTAIQKDSVENAEESSPKEMQNEVLVMTSVIQKDASKVIELLQNSMTEKREEIGVLSENLDNVEEAKEIEKPTKEAEEQEEVDDLEKSLRSSEQFEDMSSEQVADSSSETVKGSLEGKDQTDTNEEVLAETYAEKQSNSEKDLVHDMEQEGSSAEITKSSQVDDIDSESAKPEPSSAGSDLIQQQLKHDVIKRSEEVVSKTITILDDNDRISCADTETVSSKASSLAEPHIPLSINEEADEDQEEHIINVDEISNDGTDKNNDTRQEKEDTNEGKTEETIIVTDDGFNLLQNSVSDVIPSPNHTKKVNDPDDVLGLEVRTINRSKQRRSSLKGDVSINLCDSDSDVVCNGPDSSYKSPVKKIRAKSYASISKDDIFGFKNRVSSPKKTDIFERSKDPKYSIPFRQEPAKGEDLDSNNEVVELSDEEKEDENVESCTTNVANNTFQSDSAMESEVEKDRSITIDIVEEETLRKDDTKTEVQEIIETSTFANSNPRRSLDKTTITMHELVKAGENGDKSLPNRIHRVVDIFCAGLKNKSDLSINVSLEYTGQGSDAEDEKDKLEISLSASDANEHNMSYQKGSKRRRICRDSETSRNSENEANENKTQEETSPKTSMSVSSGEKLDSTKKVTKRRSTIGNEVMGTPDFKNSNVAKSSPRVSFLVNTENDESPKRKKNRKSIGDILDMSQENDRKTTPKKTLPPTPYKKLVKESGDSTAESTDDDDEEDNDENMISQSEDSKTLENLLVKSFEGDENDTTWRPDKKQESVSDKSATDESDVEEEEDEEEENNDESKISQLDNSKTYENLLVTSFEGDENDTTWTPGEEQASDSDEESSDESDIDEEEENLEETINTEAKKTPSVSENSSDEVFHSQEKQEDSPKIKTRKLFRLSSYSASKTFGSTESDEVEPKKEKTKSKAQKEIEKVTVPAAEEKNKRKKKVKPVFKSKNVGNILPETSEINKKIAENRGRKRRHSTHTQLDEGEERSVLETEDSVLKTKTRPSKKSKKEVLVPIKPSAERSKNRKALRMKPSRKMCSGWSVTTFC